MKSVVHFGDEKIKDAFDRLLNSKTESKMLHKWISRAIGDLAQNCFCGIQVPKKIIPKKYVQKYSIDNLWKYDLPKGWRLIYSVADGEVQIVSIILEWMCHSDYENRFKY